MIYACSFENCVLKFDRPSKLRNHLNLHAGIRTFICRLENCRKSFSNSSHLKRHIKNVHEETKECVNLVYACTFVGCKSTFRTTCGLQKHELKHVSTKNENINEQKNISIQKCSRNVDERQRRTKRLKCTGPQTFFCTEENCRKSFYRSGHLKHHVRHVHDKADKCIINVHACSFMNCKATFHTISELRKHESKHEPTEKRNLNEQRNVTEKENRLKPQFSKNTSQNERIEKNQSNFTCMSCNKVFATRSNLVSHINVIHNTDCAIYICGESECSKVFRYKRNMVAHTLRDHLNVVFECGMPNCTKTFKHKKSLVKHLHKHKQILK